MDTELKKRIIKRYLEQISVPYEEIENVPFYKELGDALDTLEQTHHQLLDFPNVETDEAKWERLSDVLGNGVTITIGAPSVITAIAPRRMIDRARSIEDRIFINELPKPDYYNRITTIDNDTQRDIITPLIETSRDKLVSLLHEITKNTDFDATSNTDVESLIQQLKDEKKQAKKANNYDQAANLKKYLTVAKDLLKINKLTAIAIPGENGGGNTYCTLAEAAGGVTEKISLVSLATVTTQLQRLQDTDIDSIDDYLSNHHDYKLSTEGILKLPKHGDIKEVQREAMALNVSRILALDTTRSSIVTHDGQPALFVPFDDIKLMKEFAKGKTFEAFEPFKKEKKTYQHYSTINTVGSGLQSDQFIDDFGDSFGLFYVCSDPDSIGGYNQNKALRDNRSLYIFDQVIMSTDKMKLDSRLSLQPDEFFMKHTRHGQGRNRTLIEDSSLSSKFDSLMHLLAQQNRIYTYATTVADRHQEEIERLEDMLNNPLLSEENKQVLIEKRKQVTDLKDDAIETREAIKARIDKISGILPKVRTEQHDSFRMEHIKQSLVLEKLLHNPTLFTDDGRPYKNPWTYRQDNPVKTLERLRNGNILLKFKSKPSAKMVDFIKRHGSDSIRLNSSKAIEISEEDLFSLNETILHPESKIQMKHEVDYLNPDDLKQISTAYGEGHRGRILKLVDDYISEMTKPTNTQEMKLLVTRNAVIFLQRYINTAKDKGFGMHVLKKLHFDIQQRLQNMIPLEHKPNNLNEAFNAALKLDRVDVFNKVMAEAIKQNKVNSEDFLDFLQICIDQEAQATDHIKAIESSNFISEHGNSLLETLKSPLIVLEDISDNELDIDPEKNREEELNSQKELNENIIPLSNSQKPGKDEVTDLPTVGIKVK